MKANTVAAGINIGLTYFTGCRRQEAGDRSQILGTKSRLSIQPLASCFLNGTRMSPIRKLFGRQCKTPAVDLSGLFSRA